MSCPPGPPPDHPPLGHAPLGHPSPGRPPDRPPDRRSGAHIPLRPLWICRRCGHPWPCATARLTLLSEYRDNRIALHVYLGSALFAATADLYRLNPEPGPDPAALFTRFLGWARPDSPP